MASRYVFRKDPCGIFCLLLTYGCVIYSDYCVVDHVLRPTMTTNSSLWAAFHVTIFNILLFLLCYSHAKACFSDPGIVPLPVARLDFSEMRSVKYLSKNNDEWNVCTRCEAYRPPRAHHCRVCERCVKKMDHHCPWINNCVGESNQKFFILFLLYTGLSSLYAIILTVSSFLKPCHGCSENYIKKTRVFHMISLLVITCLFSLFVFCIMYDQIYSILYDITAVEQVQSHSPSETRKPSMALLAEIFGRGSRILWLFPCSNPQQIPKAVINYDV